jgi:hypothetical protein
MQTIHWDEEIKLIDGLFCDINLDQDFSAVLFLGRQPITGVPITQVIEEIKRLETEQDQLKRMKIWASAPIRPNGVSKKQKKAMKRAMRKHHKALEKLGL